MYVLSLIQRTIKIILIRHSFADQKPKPKYNPETWSQLNCAFNNDCRNKWNYRFWTDANSFHYSFIPRTDSAWNGLFETLNTQIVADIVKSSTKNFNQTLF